MGRGGGEACYCRGGSRQAVGAEESLEGAREDECKCEGSMVSVVEEIERRPDGVGKRDRKQVDRGVDDVLMCCGTGRKRRRRRKRKRRKRRRRRVTDRALENSRP